jgi:ATP-dependent helicase/nuclease subunit A
MKHELVIPLYTKESQRRAADPRASAWVSANAGAGKTKVLTDRVLRLLLSGSAPSRILCLTFTKAAAANMSIRVFERLGRWVTLDDEALRAELEELEGAKPSVAHLRLARTLFARAVETPGGLKIDTIHAFCERLLHLVPFEANVPARFTVLDETDSLALLEDSKADVLAQAAGGRHPDLTQALELVSIDAAGETLSGALNAALRCKAFLHSSDTTQKLREVLGLDVDDTLEAVDHAILNCGIRPAEWPAFIAAFQEGSKRDHERAESLIAASRAENDDEKIEAYLSLFFTKEDKPRAESTLATKAVDADIKQRLVEEQLRVVALVDKKRAVAALERTQALFRLARAIDARIARRKTALGALDFEDLIGKTVQLLSRQEAAWILYKLDRGIDHVLIDEAQDTNPAQWDIVRRITEDFTAGAGASGGRVRTVFAVGDPKQSIYGFQGAEPREFERSRTFWERKIKAAELRFEDVRLTLSFRSVEAVLTAVDATFGISGHFKGLSFEDSAIGTIHESARPHAPGLVELWDIPEPATEDEPDAWTEPLDKPAEDSPPIRVAKRIADAVRIWTTQGDETGRIWKPGDVLVLVRKRGAAFDAVIRALKDRGVPVAGADRLNIGEHIAVLDLVAAGRAALLPDDDLTLATALKSPLVGWSEEELAHVASTRGDDESLFAALQRHAEAGEHAARRACDILRSWRGLANKHGAFGFYAHLLGPCGGRCQLVARLGGEAGDAIDSFLSFAQSSERMETPSLMLFLDRFESAAHTIKRDLDSVNDEVRVMTVHGAKGLEAPLVILIDGCDVLGRDAPILHLTNARGETVPVWSTGAKHDCEPLVQARSIVRERGEEEHNRLLYVAMTRAKDRLVIAPYLRGNVNAPPPNAWSEMIRAGLGDRLQPRDTPWGPVQVWKDDKTKLQEPVHVPPTRREPVVIPSWIGENVTPEPEPLPPIRPSSALGAADRLARPGDGPYAPEARLRGTLVHALVEHLPRVPEDRREASARAFVRARAPRLSPEVADGVVRDAVSLVTNPALAPLFGPQSRAEAPLAGRVTAPSGEILVSGQIDRLAILDDAILIADFKTSAKPPPPGAPLPQSYVAQLALYRRLMQDIDPSKPVRAFLVWTAGPLIVELTEAQMQAALARVEPV